MESFYDIVRRNPELAIFLTLAIGFYVRSLKIAGFSFGSVVGVLMTGLVVGQVGVPISPETESIFFLFSYLQSDTQWNRTDYADSIG
jgi:putative transport protein